MERCPVCKAKFKENPVCYRCGTDLSVLLRIERQAELLEQQAVALYGAGHLSEAQQLAKQSLALQRSPPRGWLVEFLAWETQNPPTQEKINTEIN
jgi:predicted amidophosphoribosyltransferase